MSFLSFTKKESVIPKESSSTKREEITKARFLLGKGDGVELYILADAFLKIDGTRPTSLKFNQVTMMFGNTKLTKDHLLRSADQKGTYYLVKAQGVQYILEDKKAVLSRNLDNTLKNGNYKSIKLDETKWSFGSNGLSLTQIRVDTCTFNWQNGSQDDDWKITIRCANYPAPRRDRRMAPQEWMTGTLNKTDYLS